jgi:predicted acyltransferase
LLTSGLSLQVLAMIYWVVGELGHRSWTKLLHIAGVNALVFYILAWSIQRIISYGRFTATDGTTVMFRHFLRDNWPAGKFGSLGFSMIYLTLCFLFVAYLYRKRWYVKV